MERDRRYPLALAAVAVAAVVIVAARGSHSAPQAATPPRPAVLSHKTYSKPPDAQLPEAVAEGREPLLIVGAMAGG